ncbi:arginine--tRNA ligase [Patescibacteria group bacterium]|nr:arginine--tRNA ligase [Patescibacteria group bacterium]
MKNLINQDTQIVKNLKDYILKASKKLGLKIDQNQIILTHPPDSKFGHFSANTAFILAKKLKQNPMELAEQFKKELDDIVDKTTLIEKIEIAPPGFINFYFKKDFLFKQAEKLNYQIEFKKNLKQIQKGKKYLLEHTSPDPIKTVHIGHLRNNFIGMAVSRIYKLLGAKVTLDCINNDRGTHVCRAILGYLIFGRKNIKTTNYIQKIKTYKLSDEQVKNIAQKSDWKNLLASWIKDPKNWYTPKDFDLNSDKFNNCFYSLGQRATELKENCDQQVKEILTEWEKDTKELRQLWRQIIDWSMQGYDQTYRRIGSRHDQVWHESDHYSLGKKWVEKGLKKGIFKKLADGAILSNLKKYGLTDAILIKKDGTTLYHTQDLELTHRKIYTYPSDLYIWDIGNDQKLYLQQLYAICEQLGIEKKGNLFHLNYGFITLAGGAKMSSRYGGVINADDLLDELKEKAKKIIKKSDSKHDFNRSETEELSENIAISACKFGFLRYSREKDFAFDINSSLSMMGDSGPYLQYTYARCKSVLLKSKIKEQKNLNNLPQQINQEEQQLLDIFYQFEEKIIESAQRFSPSVICQYLLSVARAYNEFYSKHKIIGDKQEIFRVFLTQATSNILKLGLNLLGIKAVEKI